MALGSSRCRLVTGQPTSIILFSNSGSVPLKKTRLHGGPPRVHKGIVMEEAIPQPNPTHSFYNHLGRSWTRLGPFSLTDIYYVIDHDIIL